LVKKLIYLSYYGKHTFWELWAATNYFVGAIMCNMCNNNTQTSGFAFPEGML